MTALVIAAVMVAVPGAAATAALSRRVELTLPTWLASVFALGYAVTGCVALLLALAGMLSPASFLGGLVAVTLMLCVGAIRGRGGWAPFDQLRAEPLALGGGLAVVGMIALARLRFDPILNLGSAGRWRYWADGLELADLGNVPDRILQWGGTYPATVSKVYLNAFSGGLSYGIGPEAVHAYGALLWIATIGLALALWALAWELRLRLTAPLVPLLAAVPVHVPLLGVGLNERLVVDQGIYKAEDMGRMVAVCGLALAVRGLRTPRARQCTLVGGGLLGVAAVTHLIPALVAALLLGAYAACFAVVERAPRAAISSLLATGGVAVALAGAVLLAAGGDLGFEGAGGGYRAVDGGLDPTAVFAGKQRQLQDESIRWYLAPSELVRSYGEAAFGVAGGTGATVTALVAVLAAAAAGSVLLQRALAPIPPAAALTGVALLAAALFLSWRNYVYIPATFGQRRLFDYASLPLVLIAAAWLEAGLGTLGRRVPRAPALATAGLLLLSLIAVAVNLRPATDELADARRLGRQMNAVREHVPCGARLLANRRSNAVFEVLAGRVSVLEGMAPYLRPEMLDQVLGEIAAGQAFLADPSAHRDMLDRWDVDYVAVLAGGGRIGRSANREALAAAPFLKQVHADNDIVIYRLSGERPRRPAQPGYECDSEPVDV